ncbi:HNH endonuclease [Mycobacteroides franklinii]|uniref:HNH endonuclease n=2 Tax=Mycobacteroides franklinii TaxID=948102 RepID=UPI002E8E002D|nr:HNH endonuclease [Mycobacteroides franklinii]
MENVGMACSRGAAEPSDPTRRRLWADSAGFCGNPDCLTRLVVEDPDGQDVHFAEAAHIIAASETGPRGESAASAEERGAWNNLLLLCANCHTLVDKSAAAYPVDLLLEWKRSRIEKTEQALGIASFATREEARTSIQGLLVQNRVIHEDFGPDNDYSINPEAEEAAVWRRSVIETVIPNHRRILRVADGNRDLLLENEIRTIERYRSHVGDLEARHVHNRRGLVSRRYPTEMDNLFE